MQVAVVALEYRMRFQADDDVEIARRSAVQPPFALTGQANAIVPIDPCGDFYRQRLVPLDTASAAAGRAWFGYDLAAAVTLRAGLLDGKKTLRHAHLPLTVAGGAGLGLRSRLGARAVAGRALLQRGDADLGFGAAGRLFQRQLEVVAQIRAAIHAIAAAPSAARARAAENLAEDVAECIGVPADAFRSAEDPCTGGADHSGSIEAALND